jgi:hypothetical protein
MFVPGLFILVYISILRDEGSDDDEHDDDDDDDDRFLVFVR